MIYQTENLRDGKLHTNVYIKLTQSITNISI